MVLMICRTRAHQRARLRDVDASVAQRVWTLPDLHERLCAWAALKDGVARDGLGARVLAAAVLADAGALLPRLAPGLDALRQELVHARTSARALLDVVSGGVDDDGVNDQGRPAEVRLLLERVAAVEQALQRKNVVDDALALERARSWLQLGVRPGFLQGVARVVVEDAVDASALDVAVFAALSKHVPVTLRLPVDDARPDDGGRAALRGVDVVYRAVEGDASGAVDVDAVSVVGSGALAEFRGAVFTDAVVEGADVAVRVLADAAAEARFVAGAVSAWRRTSSTSIAVAVRDDRHIPAFLDALRLQGLPVRRRRRALIESPAARLLLDLAGLRLEGAPRERLLSVLTNPARKTNIGTDDGARVLSTLRKAAARRDLEDHTRPSGGYRHRLQRLQDRDPGAAADVAFVLGVVEPVLALSSSLPLSAPLALHFTTWLGIVGSAVDDARGLGGAEVKELVARLRAGTARTGDPAAPVDLPALVRLVEREFQSQPWLDDEVDVDDDAVEVVNVKDLIGRRFDHVAIARVVEGELPQPAPRSGLLSDPDRARLNRAVGQKLLRLQDEERLGPQSSPSLGLEGVWWLTALASAKASLLLTAPRVDLRGREHAPSAFLLDAARVLGASPDDLAKDGRAGADVDVDEDARSRDTRKAKADAQIVGSNASLFAEMVKQRRHWFVHPDAAYADRRAPFAFAVDKQRVARAFGTSFGLLAKKPLTPTRLEALAECRMHGFVQQVLKLDVDPEPGNAIEARVQGTLGHAVLERFYAERKAQRVPLTRMNAADRARLAAIVDDAAAPLLAGKTTGHLAALSASIEFLKQTLLRVTTTLARRPPVEGVEPVDFEVQIGANTRERAAQYPAVSVEVAEGRRLWLGGIIDRVDEGEGGRAVVDYKTMSSSRVKEKATSKALLQTHFQLLVYLRLLESARPTHPSVPLHGHLVSLKDGGTSKDVAEMEQLRDRVVDDAREDGLARAIGRVVLPILDGTLPPDANDRCVDCRLQRVCRVPLEGAYAIDPDELVDEEAP